jgi:PAS domain S-box-containing protein
MTIGQKLTYEELELRLHETEEIIRALRHQEVDAIVGDTSVALVRLREVEQALKKAQEELELRVAERTAELAQVNKELRETIEQQQRTARQLEENERKYRELVAVADKAQRIARIGNWQVDLENRSTWWSDETYRVLGLEPGQIEPSCEALSQFVHPQDRQQVVEMINDALESSRPFSLDHRIVHPGGEERYVHTEAEIAFDVGGKPARMTGIIQCITDRKRAQLQLEESASQLQGQAELLDLAHDMIFVHDMDGRITFWNRGAEHTFGFKRDEAIGQLSHRLLRTEYCEPLIRITARIIKEGRWEGELIHTTRDGRQLTVASRWALRRGSGGRPVAILEIDNDITDRKRAEQEMAEAQRFAENIVNTIQESLVVLDPHLRIVSANRAFHEAFQTTPDRIHGRLFFSLHEGLWDVPELRRRLRDVAETNAGFDGLELERRLPDGSTRPLMLSACPIRGRDSGSELILLVIQDISVQKQHEREIQADKAQLSALTEELIVTEERQRQQIAAALHDSICQSLAFAKRELSTMQRSAPSAMREQLRQVCDQVAEAIDQARNLTLELAPSVLYTLGLEAALEDLAEQFASGHHLGCHVRIAEEPKPLNDQIRSLLYRAVRELLVNVSKHARAKNVSIGVVRDGSDIRITIEDDGRGFDPAKLKDRSDKEGGFGIFSIQQRLTHIGGTLSIESAEGRGTKVTLVAPLKLT